MKKNLKIIRYRKRYPYKSGMEIARMAGATWRYAYKVLKDNDLPVSSPIIKRKVIYCTYCGEPTERHNKNHPACYYAAHHTTVRCAFCHVTFDLSNGRIRDRYKSGYKTIYCGRMCYNRGQSENATRFKRGEHNEGRRLRGFTEDMGTEDTQVSEQHLYSRDG